jgi:hypothetical protein
MVPIKYKMPLPRLCLSAVTFVLNCGAINVAPTQKDQPLFSWKWRPNFQTHKLPRNEHKLGHVSRRGPKPRTTVLARPNSNFLD